MAAASAAQLRELVREMKRDIELGREEGASFWRRFDVNAAVLDRVADRDEQWADLLEKAERYERNQLGCRVGGPPKAPVPVACAC